MENNGPSISEVPQWKRKLPMQITYARIFITLPVVLCMLSEQQIWRVCGVFLFFVAAISDYYDGYFARKFNTTSNLGKFMDPIADKILVTSVLTILLYLKQIDPFMAILIFARDNFISGIRSAAAADQLIIDAKSAGKWKTGIQMLGIPLLMIGTLSIPNALTQFLGFGENHFQLEIGFWGYGLLWIGALLSLWSGLEYFLIYLKSLKSKGSSF